MRRRRGERRRGRSGAEGGQVRTSFGAREGRWRGEGGAWSSVMVRRRSTSAWYHHALRQYRPCPTSIACVSTAHPVAA
eukprot:679005-Rhodomonas_salina.1